MTNNQPITIGPHTFIDIKKGGINGVPAKVDTGADSSSVWASNISDKKGRLSFTLFDKGSKYYNGQIITTSDYKITTIRNSFGHTEIRYRVKLPVAIEGRTIRATFTLADRSQNRYPILVGRRTLQGKFVVDVSRPRRTKSNALSHVLVLGSAPTEELAAFLQDVSKDIKTSKTKFVIRSYKDLVFQINEAGVKVFESKSGKDIGSFDLVYFKSHKRSYVQAISLASYLKYANVSYFDQELLSHVSYDKLSEYIRLAINGLSVPATLCANKDYLIKNHGLLSDKTGWPLVCKEVSSDRGKKNFLVHNAKELKAVLAKAKDEDLYVLQQFIANDGYLRAYLMGSEVQLAVFRGQHSNKNPLKQHLNNPSGSINARLVEVDKLDSSVKNMAVLATKVMNRQVAGVDLIQDKVTKQWYVLEVNSAPQLRSGSFIDEKRKAFAKFIDNELNR
jgi:glutathione synthase/RimK-type ligase-like ATP-grasp enzyme